MAYRWTEEGPAFEFPTPFAVENRMLVWRGWLLLLLAIAMAAVTGYLQGLDVPAAAVAIEDRPEPAAAWPHYLLALLLAVTATLDLVRASRQSLLRLQRGQPASLAQEVPHEATGVGAGAPALMQALLKGERPPGVLTGPYQRFLRALGPVQHAPRPLQVFLAARIAHLLLGAALLAVLGLGVVLLLKKAAALPVLAIVISVLGAAFVAKQVLQTAEPPFGRLVLGTAVGLALLAVVPLFLFGGRLTALERLQGFQLPLALGVALVSGLLFEWFGLMAGRAQLPREQPYKLAREEAAVAFGGDPRNLMQEVERELYRRWTEGVPNRRYAWQPPFVDRAAVSGECRALVLEESQPLVHPLSVAAVKKAPRPEVIDPDAPVRAAPAPRLNPPPGAGWLRLLAVCGLVWAVVGALLWLWLAYSRMKNPAAPWWPAALGLAFLGGAGYALRVGHLLWSRMELQSTLTWLDMKGNFLRTGGAAPAAPEKVGTQRAEKPVQVDTLDMHCGVVQLRSVFYAAVPARALGMRTLLDWAIDMKGAEAWIGFVRAHTRGGGSLPPDTSVPRAPGKPAARAAEAEAAPPRRSAKFCAACGTPVLAGARFCQHCGNSLSGD